MVNNITEYINSLPRQERAYAACFAHWLTEGTQQAGCGGGDAQTAELVAAESGKGIRKQRKEVIRATVVLLLRETK
jgi:hypothetical protein